MIVGLTMSLDDFKAFYAKRDKELKGKNGKGGIGTYYIYDEEGNLITKDKDGAIIETLVIPSYRPLSFEERDIMEKERNDHIAEATRKYDDVFQELHQETTRPDRSKERVIEKMRRMVEADYALQYARYPIRYIVKEEGVEIRRIDFDQPAEIRKLPFSLACMRVSPFSLQDLYVREGKTPEIENVSASSSRSTGSLVSMASKGILFIQDADTNEYGYLALDWRVDIRVKSVIYHCAKQALAAELAKTFKDDEGFRKIIDTQTPAEVSYSYESVKDVTPDEWANTTKTLLYDILVAKFRQYPALLSRLLETGDAVLAYYQPNDTLLGIGISTDDVRAKSPIHWKGQNLVGSILMDIRGTLRKEVEDKASSSSSSSSMSVPVPTKRFSVKRPVTKKSTNISVPVTSSTSMNMPVPSSAAVSFVPVPIMTNNTSIMTNNTSILPMSPNQVIQDESDIIQ